MALADYILLSSVDELFCGLVAGKQATPSRISYNDDLYKIDKWMYNCPTTT